MKKIFDGKKTARLGTENNPAVVNVQTEERVKELESVFEENGWKSITTLIKRGLTSAYKAVLSKTHRALLK